MSSAPPRDLLIDMPGSHSWKDLAAAVRNKLSAIGYDPSALYDFNVQYCVPGTSQTHYNLLLVWRQAQESQFDTSSRF